MSQNDDEKGSKRYNNPSLGTNNPQRRLLEHPSSLLAHENGFDSKKNSYSLLWLVKRQAQPKPNSTLVDWLDSLIVPGGLLLVAAVSQLFGIPILVYGWGWKQLRLGCKK
jgi:hypothetical protein